MPSGRRPTSSPTRPSPDALDFRYKGETQAEFEERERRCLSTAIYFEARGEPVRGQVAVGQVILNRVRSPLFPETICGVVYQGQMQKGCQFSFTCDGHSDNPRDNEQWALAQDLAKEIMAGEHWLPEVGYSTFYHANYVNPGWARRMNKIDKIGRHIFYKKRNEEPYVVEASANDAGSSTDNSDNSGYFLTPTLSLASAVSAVAGSVSAVTNSVTGSVSAVAGTSAPAPTPAISLGYAGSGSARRPRSGRRPLAAISATRLQGDAAGGLGSARPATSSTACAASPGPCCRAARRRLRSASASSSWSSVSTSTSTLTMWPAAPAPARAPARPRPRSAMWLSLISTASSRPKRWLMPPPQRTAYFSKARRPGVVLRVQTMRALGARPRPRRRRRSASRCRSGGRES